MRESRAPALRALLRGKHSDGATAQMLATELDLSEKSRYSVFDTLRGMPDTYIDRWLEAPNVPPSAVWCVVVPPDDMPKPKRKRK